MEPLAIIGWSAVGVLFVGWLTVSFSAPGRRRTVIEWTSATAMYVALLSLFVTLVRNAIASGNTVALVAFGFLCVLFGGGLLVAVYRTVAAARGAEDSAHSATH